MLGSAPMAVQAAAWPRDGFDAIVAINNAWRVRPDWDLMIYPWDFPEDRRPVPGPGQVLVTEADFVPAQNALGGFVYAGATMAYTAAYWALHALRPDVIATTSNYLGYPNANKDATALVEQKVRENPGVYPSPQTMATLYPLEPLPLKMERVRTRVWSKVKTGS